MKHSVAIGFIVGYLGGLAIGTAVADGLDLPIGKPRPGGAPEPDEQLQPAPPLDPERPGPLDWSDGPPPPPELDWFGERIVPEGGRAVYLIDRSGSMDRTVAYDASQKMPVRTSRLDRVVAATIISINSLDERMRFSIVAWAGQRGRDGQLEPDRDVLWPEVREATPANKAEAAAWLEALRPNGGTMPGLHCGWALRHFDRCERFLLLSDGLPSDPPIARYQIRAASGGTKHVHTFGLGLSERARQWMLGVASDTGGTYTPID